MRGTPALILVACALVAGCGGSGDRAESTTAPTPTATPTATPTPSPTAFANSAPEPPTDIPSEQTQEQGGPGDERTARYRTRLRIGRAGIRPTAVAVRGFFALEFVIRNDTPRRHRVAFTRRAVAVPARATRRLRTGGVQPGRHFLRAGAAGRVEVLAAPPGEP